MVKPRAILARLRKCAPLTSIFLLVVLFIFVNTAVAVVMRPQNPSDLNRGIPKELEDIGIKEHLGEQIKGHILKNEEGKLISLEELFKNDRPVILTLVYYQCPNLCNFILNGLVAGLKKLDWTVGEKFDIITVSINPKETPELAEQKKLSYLRSYGRTNAEKGWHFLVGLEESVKSLAAEVGFGYRYDPKDKQYAHSAAIFILTPDRKISRYLYGIEFEPETLRLALLEASQGKIGSVVDRIKLFCYRYDPQTKKYSIYLTQLMQLGCGVTMLIFGAYLFMFWRRQLRRQSKGA